MPFKSKSRRGRPSKISSRVAEDGPTGPAKENTPLQPDQMVSDAPSSPASVTTLGTGSGNIQDSYNATIEAVYARVIHTPSVIRLNISDGSAIDYGGAEDGFELVQFSGQHHMTTPCGKRNDATHRAIGATGVLVPIVSCASPGTPLHRLDSIINTVCYRVNNYDGAEGGPEKVMRPAPLIVPSPAVDVISPDVDENLLPCVDKFYTTPKTAQFQNPDDLTSSNDASEKQAAESSRRCLKRTFDCTKGLEESTRFVKLFYRRRSVETRLRQRRTIDKTNYVKNRQSITEERKRRGDDIRLTEKLVKTATAMLTRQQETRNRIRVQKRYWQLRSSEKKKKVEKTAFSIKARYSKDSPFRNRMKHSNTLTTQKFYHSNSPYRRSVLQRSSDTVKKKYARFASYRLKCIRSASLRSATITASSSKKRQRRTTRVLQYKPGSSNVRRRKLFTQSFHERDRRIAARDRYQKSDKFKKWKQSYDRQRHYWNFQSRVRDRAKACLPSILSCVSRWRKTNCHVPQVPYLKKGTAEYTKTKANQWKRFKINYLLATYLPSQRDQDGECNENGYRRCREEVTRTLEQLLIWQKQQRSLLYQQCSKIERLYTTASNLKNQSDESSVAEKLASFYGGLRYHVASQEEMICDPSTFQYETLNQVVEVDDDDENANKVASSDIMARRCDESCEGRIPMIWPMTLHDKLRLLNPELLIEKLLRNVAIFEACRNCDILVGRCPILVKCEDTLRCVYDLKSHYSGLRTLMNILYRLRRNAYELHLVEMLLKVGTYDNFLEYKERRFPDYIPNEDNQGDSCVLDASRACDKYVQVKFKNMIAQFRKRIYSNMPIYECFHCLRLVSASQSKRFQREDKFWRRPQANIALSDYQAYFNREPSDPVITCMPCYRLLSKGQQSQYSYKNLMWPARMPQQLLSLNAYEQMMISLAKCFQRIIRLRPCRYRNIADSCLTKAIKGLVVHLPLPFNSVKNVCDILTEKIMLPDVSNFIIQLDGLPNLSKRLVFRSLVNMSKVMDALSWLKANNILYKNVHIDTSFIQMPDVNLPQMYRDLVPLPEIVDTDAEASSGQDIAATINDLVDRERIDEEESSNATSTEAANSVNDPTMPQKVPESAILDNIVNRVFDSAGSEEGESRTTRTDKLCRSPNKAKEIVDSLGFAIPYAVPYRSVLVDALADKETMVMHVPEGDLLEQYSVVDMSPMMPNKSSLDLFAMKPISGVPLKWEDPYVDVASFPSLFPDGRNGLFEKRGRRITPAYYLEHRLKMSDPRYRRHQPYIFDSAVRKDMMSINGSIYHMLNFGSFGHITAKSLLDGSKNPSHSKKLEDNVHALLGSIVGTLHYWLRVRKDVEAVIEEYGPATFFLTFSCAEYRNEDFSDFLIFRNFDIPNVRNVPTRNLASIDPVSVSLHFDNRFDAFWKDIIMAEDGPLGCVEIFYIKKEYQQRGAPHMHVLVWIKDAPKLGKDNDEEVLSFLDERISCSMPDVIESPTLHGLVSTFQQHKCTTTCTRYAQFKKGYGRKLCRFGFPRPVTRRSVLNNLEEVLASRVGGSRRMQLYNLARANHEIMVNDYNPALLYMWQANIDVQYVGHDNPAITYYTTAYMSKGESQKTSEVAQSLNASLSKAGMMKQFCCRMLNSRELGAYEAADKVLRNPMYRLSVYVKSAAFYRPAELRRRLLPIQKLRNLKPDSTDVFCRNFQCSYYPDRPDSMDKMSAYEILRWFEVQPGKSKKTTSHYIAKHLSSFVRRSRPAVLKMYRPMANTAEAYEKYSFLLVALFKPWRTDGDLLTDCEGNVQASYAATFEAIKDSLPDMLEYAAAKERFTKPIEYADKIKQKAAEQAEMQELEEREAQKRKQIADEDLTVQADLCFHSDAARILLTEEQLEEECASLNEGQKMAYDAILNKIAVQNQSQGSEDDITKAPLQLYVSGVGGTGKSHLIKCIKNYIEYHYSTTDEPAVLVAAPTGIAAMNIDGITIHKLLKLPIQKSERMHQLYYNLACDDLKMLRRLFRNVRLLIIDEISMLSNMYLLFVYKRLNEILIDLNENPEASFGNVNVLLLGDLLQLPPVNAPHVFTTINASDVTKAFGSIGAAYNLWQMFDFVELTENMRQREDSVYASLLERVRIGSPTAEDIRLLKSRVIDSEGTEESDWDGQLRLAVQQYLSLMDANPSLLCLMPLNVDVTQFNLYVMELLKLTVVECTAKDMMEETYKSSRMKQKLGSKDGNKRERKGKRKLKVSETGGLEEKLHLAIGAKVMLRRNMDPKRKLVNGSIGVLREIQFNPHTKEPEVIRVEFPGVDQPVSIAKLTTKFMIGNGLFMNRVQFPVTLAYAITIHKCQGLSLDVAMVDVGPSTFTDSMCYVALSRVKKLSNLHLIRFAPSVVKCDKRCVTEYNRLRTVANEKLRAKGLSQLPLIVNYNANPEFKKYSKKIIVSAEEQKKQLSEEIAETEKIRGRPVKRKLPIAAAAPPEKKEATLLGTCAYRSNIGIEDEE